MKKWIWAIIAIVLAIVSFLGIMFVKAMSTTIKYGTPHYRPQVE